VGFRGLWGDFLTDEEDGLDSSMLWLRLSYAWNPTATKMAKQQTEAAER
jgi:hypothetical protein